MKIQVQPQDPRHAFMETFFATTLTEFSSRHGSSALSGTAATRLTPKSAPGVRGRLKNPAFYNFDFKNRDSENRLRPKISKLKSNSAGNKAHQTTLKKSQSPYTEKKLPSAEYIINNRETQGTDLKCAKMRRQSNTENGTLNDIMRKENTATTVCSELDHNYHFVDNNFDHSILINRHLEDSIIQEETNSTVYPGAKDLNGINNGDLFKKRTTEGYHNKLIDFIKQNQFKAPDRPIKRNKAAGPNKHAQHLLDEVSKTQMKQRSFQVYTENKVFDYQLNALYKTGKLLGKGSYAEVRLATRISDEQRVAIKSFPNITANTQQSNKVIQNEIRVLKSVNHPNIIKLIDIVVSKEYTHLVLEYCEGINLYELMHNRNGRGLSENVARRIFIQLLDAVNYLHSCNIYHRDLKLDNVMIDRNGKITLIDFGFAITVNDNSKLTSFCGTPNYMAPEIYQMIMHQGAPLDIWALAVILYKLTVGEFPFTKSPTDQTPKTSIIEVNYRMPSGVSTDLAEIFRRVFVKEPEGRISMSGLWQLSWLYCDI